MDILQTSRLEQKLCDVIGCRSGRPSLHTNRALGAREPLITQANQPHTPLQSCPQPPQGALAQARSLRQGAAHQIKGFSRLAQLPSSGFCTPHPTSLLALAHHTTTWVSSSVREHRSKFSFPRVQGDKTLLVDFLPSDLYQPGNS